MSYRSNIMAGHIGDTARMILADHDAVVVTKNKTDVGTTSYNVQGLNEKLEVPKKNVPVYGIKELTPPLQYSNLGTRYNVTRTYQGKQKFVALFQSEDDAKAFMKHRTANAHTEVTPRYKMEQRGSWLCILDTEGAPRFPIAKFAAAAPHHERAAAYLAKLNEE